MAAEGFLVAVLGGSSLDGRELCATLESGEGAIFRVLRMGDDDLSESADDRREVLMPLDWDRIGEADFTVLCGVSPEVRGRALSGTGAGTAWLIDLDAPAGSPWIDPFAGAREVRASGPYLALPDPAALYAALVGRALADFDPGDLLLQRFLPASALGEEGILGLHAQATALLSFKPLPASVFPGQAAFNLLPLDAPGPGPLVEQVARLWPASGPLAESAFHSSLFHCAGLAMWIRVPDPEAAARGLRVALEGSEAIRMGEGLPSPQEAVSQGFALGGVRPHPSGWLFVWVVYDNITAGRARHAARAIRLLAGG